MSALPHKIGVRERFGFDLFLHRQPPGEAKEHAHENAPACAYPVLPARFKTNYQQFNEVQSQQEQEEVRKVPNGPNHDGYSPEQNCDEVINRLFHIFSVPSHISEIFPDLKHEFFS